MYAFMDQEKEKKKSIIIQKKKQETVRPNQKGFPEYMKVSHENTSGFSFDDVRIQYKSNRPSIVIQKMMGSGISEKGDSITTIGISKEAVSVFPTGENLRAKIETEKYGVLTRATLSSSHVMIIFEWHEPSGTEIIVQHLAVTNPLESEEKHMALIERKDLNEFNIIRLAASKTALFEHKLIADKGEITDLLSAEKGKTFPYGQPHNCITWANSIWDKF